MSPLHIHVDDRTRAHSLALFCKYCTCKVEDEKPRRVQLCNLEVFEKGVREYIRKRLRVFAR